MRGVGIDPHTGRYDEIDSSACGPMLKVAGDRDLVGSHHD